MRDIQRLDRTVSPNELAAVMHTDGAAIIVDLVDAAALDELDEQMRPYIDATPTSNVDLGGRQTRRTGGLAGRSQRARELIMHPLIVETGKLALAPSAALQISNTEVIAIGPGEAAQPVHRDQDIWDYPFPPGYEFTFSVMWPITDFTAENGATRVIPGSHRSGRHDSFRESEIVQATMSKGSVMMWLGSLYHGGGANRTDSWRRGLMFAYVLGWLRQEENQYLAVPRDVAATLDQDMLRMIGYARGGQAIGNGVDRSDPLGTFIPEMARPGQIDVELLEGYPLSTVES